jgi:integrase
MATIYKRGDLSWQVKVRRKQPSGDAVRQTRTFERYDEAKRWADVIEGRISGHEYVDKSKERRTSLKEIIERYLKEVTPTKGGAKQEEYRLNQWMREEWASWSIVSVETTQIVQWRDRRIAEGKKPSTISNALNLLSAVFKQSLEWGYKVGNPVQGVKRPKPNAGREAYLDADEEERLFTACEQGPPWLSWCFRIALATAMRASEIRRLQWRHVHEEKGYVHLPETKNDEKRNVPLVLPQSVILFRELRSTTALPHREDGYVFGDPTKEKQDGGFTKDMLSQAFADAAAAAKIEVTFHDLRHVAITRLVPLHRDALDLSKTTGHKTLSILARYYNEKIEDRVERLQRIAAALTVPPAASSL